jgi:hypothetical protein
MNKEKYREYADYRLTSPKKIGPAQRDIISAKTAELPDSHQF